MARLKSLDEKIRIDLKEGDHFRVGRSTSCDVVIDHLSVSSIHAVILLKNHMLKITDLGSTNGTRVNYAQIDESRYVLDGDIVEFGNLTFTVEGGDLVEPTPGDTGAHTLRNLDIQTDLESVDDTQRSISVPVDSMEEDDPHTGSYGEGDEAVSRELDPRGNRSGFLVAFGLLILGGLLILAYVWTYSPPT